jgi:hypothetical protein
MARIGTAKKRKPITTRQGLLKALVAWLGGDWDIAINEIDSLSSTVLGRRPYRMVYFTIHAHLTDPVNIFASVSARSLVDLIGKVGRGELRDAIAAEFARCKKPWAKAEQPELLDDEDDDELAEGPRRIEGKQLALTYTPAE